MRPAPASLVGRIRPWLALLALVALGCQEPTGGGRVRRVEVSAPDTALRPGSAMQVTAVAYDAAGVALEGVAVRWRTLTPALLAVDDSGVVRALAPGMGRAQATIEGVSGTLDLALVNPPVATLALEADTLVLTVPDGQRALAVTALDAAGVPVVRPALAWRSSAPRIASVTPTGQLFAEAVGATRVSVRADGLEASMLVQVRAAPSATAPVIASVSAATLAPGLAFTVQGSAFGATPATNTVKVDGVPVTVTAATTTQLTLAMPAAAQLPCEPTRTVTLQVATAGGIGTAPVVLQAAPVRALAPGQSAVFASAAEARCVELAGAPARYLITLPNAARTLGSSDIAVTLVGEAGEGSGALLQAAPVREAAALPAAAMRTAPAWPLTRARPAGAARAATHLAQLEQNVAAATTLARATLSEARAATPEAAAQAPSAGAIVPMRLPHLGAVDVCTNYTAFGARAVYVGANVVLLEDTLTLLDAAPTLAGRMDDAIVALGAELDARGWAIARQFGDPLAMDGSLDDDRRVLVLLSPRVNRLAGGSVLAGSATCDFFSRAAAPSSNVGEVIYARVPTSLEPFHAPGTVSQWRYEMRGTLVHELKHVASYAERIARGWPLEQPCLDEALARHAEELFARDVYGVARTADAGFAATLACETAPGGAGCVDAPRAMLPHLEGLWDFLADPTGRGVLGPAQAGDFSFYGSAWALTRWLLDDLGSAEAATYGALTASAQTGVANLEARTGRSWDELLAAWTLAMATDGRTGFTPATPALRFRAWDLTSLFSGLCEAAGSCAGATESAVRFTRPHPLQPVPVQYGRFAVDVPRIVPGGFAAVELVVPSGATGQALELRGIAGAPLPATARLAIVRVQ